MSRVSPPPLNGVNPKIIKINPGKPFVKVVKHEETVLGFRFDQAVLPFDHHAPSTSERGVYYCSPFEMEKDSKGVGLGYTCSIIERFHATRLISLNDYQFIFFKSTANLSLLDLRTKLSLTAAGVPPEIHSVLQDIKEPESRHLTQEWSRHFYENPKHYGEVDGILYNRQYGSKNLSSIVFYERAQRKLRFSENLVARFSHYRISKLVHKIVHEIQDVYPIRIIP